MFLQWSKRLDNMFERSKKLVPVHLRTKKLDYAIPARALCSYKTKEAGDIGPGWAKKNRRHSVIIHDLLFLPISTIESRVS